MLLLLVLCKHMLRVFADFCPCCIGAGDVHADAVRTVVLGAVAISAKAQSAMLQGLLM